MANSFPASSCPGCAQRDEEIARLGQRVKQLEETVAKLMGQVASQKKDSSNSSKPPSSDIVKKKLQRRGKGKRKRGGQPGHPRHERQAFDPSQVDFVHIHALQQCPCCQGALKLEETPTRVLQQVEIPARPMEVHEHRSMTGRCGHCKRSFTHAIPADIQRAGLAGPRLTTLVAFLKSVCHCSFSNIRKYLRDVVGITLSRGQLRKLCGKVSDSLERCYEQLREMLIEQAVLNVDETGHKENGKSFWTWCFRAAMFTVFRIEPSRGSKVLMDVLGTEFKGVLGCDYFSAYHKYMRLNENALAQFCMAHLIRDIKFLAEHPDTANREYGQRLIQLLRKLFGIIHQRDKYLTEEGFQRALTAVRNDLVWEATLEAPNTKEASNLAERFYRNAEAYFRFITTPGVEPTNNLAEQIIRFVAIHRRITQGTRSEGGRTWCERTWTVIATCEQQGRSVFNFLYETITSFFAGEPTPSLAAENTS